MDATDGLGNQNGNVDGFDFVALQLLDLVWNSVGDNNLDKANKNKNK